MAPEGMLRCARAARFEAAQASSGSALCVEITIAGSAWSVSLVKWAVAMALLKADCNWLHSEL